jgi:putative selenium metabolism protein SsnA
LTATPATPAATLALTGGRVVTGLDPPVVVEADVVLAGNRVREIGSAPPGVPRRDCSGALVLPGQVCAHTHLYSALSRGMPYRLPPPKTFPQILQRIWWRLDRALDEETVRLSALVGGLDALLTGTTTVVDHHASPESIHGSLDVVADALETLGLRSVLCYEVSDRDGKARARAGLAENARFLHAARPLARGMVGAHASFTLSDDTLGECVQVALDAGVGIHIHVAEDAADQRDAQTRYGRRVVPRLAASGVLRDGALLAHCVHLDPEEIAQVCASGASIAHSPRSNMNNGVGRAPVTELGARVALGTDGLGADMVTEAQVAFFRARESGSSIGPDWPLARLAYGAHLVGRAFGEASLGRLVPGAPADITVFDYAAPTPITTENLPGHVIFGLGAGRVRDVLVAGELVLDAGRPTRVDVEKLAHEASAAAARLWERLDAIDPHPYEPTGGSQP